MCNFTYSIVNNTSKRLSFNIIIIVSQMLHNFLRKTIPSFRANIYKKKCKFEKLSYACSTRLKTSRVVEFKPHLQHNHSFSLFFSHNYPPCSKNLFFLEKHLSLASYSPFFAGTKCVA